MLSHAIPLLLAWASHTGTRSDRRREKAVQLMGNPSAHAVLAMGCWVVASEPTTGLLTVSAAAAIPSMVSICSRHPRAEL
jgi:hypothetical protein